MDPWRVPRPEPLLTRNNTETQKTSGRSPRFLDLSGRCVSLTLTLVTSGVKLTFQKKNITVRHGGGSVMVWSCSAASGPGPLAGTDGTMNSPLPEDPEREHQPVPDLKIKNACVLQQDDDLKNTSRSTSERTRNQDEGSGVV